MRIELRVAVLLHGLAVIAAAATLYVRPSGETFVSRSAHSSWQTATDDLQMALDSALAGDQVWVAAGTYTPTRSVLDSNQSKSRFWTFQMRPGVMVYGGFAGNESTPADRLRDDLDLDGVMNAWEFSHPSILSGDLLGNDSTASSADDNNDRIPDNVVDNVYRVVTADSTLDTTAGLNGFIIEGGYGRVPQSSLILAGSSRGGGMYVLAGRYSACWIRNNYTYGTGRPSDSLFAGGGVYTRSAWFDSVRISSNHSDVGNGGGIMMDGPAVLENSLVDSNACNNTGCQGAGVAMNTAGVVRNSRIIGNSNNTGSGDDGGGMFLYRGGLVESSEISGNSTLYERGAGAFLAYGGELRNCRVEGNVAHGDNAGGIYMDHGGLVIGCSIVNNQAVGSGGGLVMDRGGTMDSCSVTGNTVVGNSSNGSAQGGGIRAILEDGSTGDMPIRITNSFIANNAALGNSASAFGGGLFITSSSRGTLFLGNSIVSGNHILATRTSGSAVTYARGGGIYSVISSSTSLYPELVLLEQVLIANNLAETVVGAGMVDTVEGAGIYMKGNTTLVQGAVVRNKAVTTNASIYVNVGVGGKLPAGYTAPSYGVFNTVVWGNSPTVNNESRGFLDSVTYVSLSSSINRDHYGASPWFANPPAVAGDTSLYTAQEVMEQWKIEALSALRDAGRKTTKLSMDANGNSADGNTVETDIASDMPGHARIIGGKVDIGISEHPEFFAPDFAFLGDSITTDSAAASFSILDSMDNPSGLPFDFETDILAAFTIWGDTLDPDSVGRNSLRACYLGDTLYLADTAYTVVRVNAPDYVTRSLLNSAESGMGAVGREWVVELYDLHGTLRLRRVVSAVEWELRKSEITSALPQGTYLQVVRKPGEKSRLRSVLLRSSARL